jgi:1-acyl-sn-glycerol-3-phosphate acyltransferase
MLRAMFYLVSLVVWTHVFGATVIVAALLRVPYRHWGIYDKCQRAWGRCLLWAAGVRVTVLGGSDLRVNEAHIIASNHASFFDILALAAHLPVPVKYVAKKELFRIPVFGWAIRALGHVRLDRQNLKQAFEAYEEASEIIRRQRLHVLVFPEGTRTRTGEMQPFKKGPFVLAIQCAAKVVPVYVGGTFGILPKGKVRIHPHPVVLAIGEPVSTEGLTYDDRQELAERTERAVHQMKTRADAFLQATA